MKALIAAGGKATRLRPITSTLNKHLIPLAGKPMIFYVIEKIVEAGILEIGINVNPGDASVPDAVGDGSRWGARVTYIEQTGGPLGLAHIVKTARPFLGDEPFVFYLGDNIILGSIRRFVEKFERGGFNAVVALSKVKDPQRFGVPEIVDGKIVRVDEKPAHPKSDFAVTGIYVYDSNVFKAAEAVRPSARGEYEISDVHTWLIENGFSLGFEEITGWWKDTGKPEDLLEGNALLMDETFKTVGAAIEGEVASGASVDGMVKIGAGTKIGAGVVLRGPCVIGRDCVIENATIGRYASIGDGVTITGTGVTNSIVMDRARLECGKTIANSLIGANVRIVSAGSSADGSLKMIVGENSMVEI